MYLAEAVRFELTVPFDTTVFKTVAINRTLPHFRNWCSEPESNRHACSARDFKSLVSTNSTIRANCLVEYPGIEPGMSKTADLQSTASPLMLLLRIVKHTMFKVIPVRTGTHNALYYTLIFCSTRRTPS